MWTALKHTFCFPGRVYPAADIHRKTWRRSLGDTAFRFISDRLSATQFQYALGTSEHVYHKWTKQNRLPVHVEPVGEDARLLWIGPRRTERVVLYFHGKQILAQDHHRVDRISGTGGGFLIPLSDFAASFWNHVREEFERDGMHVGVAILNYCKSPKPFTPSQTNSMLHCSYRTHSTIPDATQTGRRSFEPRPHDAQGATRERPNHR